VFELKSVYVNICPMHSKKIREMLATTILEISAFPSIKKRKLYFACCSVRVRGLVSHPKGQGYLDPKIKGYKRMDKNTKDDFIIRIHHQMLG
jgi:hypothetical protein